MYMTDTYSGQSYKYFHDSQTEELIEPSSSDISTSSIHPDSASSYQLIDLIMENRSVDSIEVDGVMRSKLEALERALLDDSDIEVEEEYVISQSMEIDPNIIDWADPDPIQNMLLRDSPKEYSSSDSNISSISREIPKISRTPKQLLYECATAISEGNEEGASLMINVLRQMVSIQGEPSQRIAAYMVEGLAARLAESGKSIYRALKFKDEMKIHIIDFDINQGSQYINLIQTLASRSIRPSHVRLTGIDDPESVQRSLGGLKIIGQRLEQLAETLGLSFEFRAVASRTSIVTSSMLNCRQGEALVVNFAFQLHHMPDESVSTVNERDQLLRLVKGLNPKLVTVVEQDVNTNTTPFFQRFVEAYNYYSAVFESLDVTLPRESQDRMNVERQCLARDIVNTVACEGEDRIERYEVAGKWRARMAMAGFISSPMSTNVSDEIRKLVKAYCDRYKIKEEKGALHFGWEDKNLIVASAWR
ncbi:Proteasome subunit YC7alpha/Y8 (protease yscE subunit 7) [Trifolium repens]|nr:Proteasome subunit YC7alpha/Y8 (protease yscE subunit 7) [Trifolium repens]